MHWRGLKSVARGELTRTLMQRMNEQSLNVDIYDMVCTRWQITLRHVPHNIEVNSIAAVR